MSNHVLTYALDMKTKYIQWISVGAIALVWLWFVLFGSPTGSWERSTWPILVLLSIALLPSLYMLYKALEQAGD